MRKLIGSVSLIAALVTLPAVAAAQAHSAAKHEFGVDIAFSYVSPDGGESFFAFGTPVDLRVGFIAGEKMTVEPRLTFFFASDDQGGESIFDYSLGLNLLYGMKSNRQGMYVTVGGSYTVADFGAANSTALTLNGGIGTRGGYGSGVVRPELFVAYILENLDDGVPSTVLFGLRLGLSLWH